MALKRHRLGGDHGIPLEALSGSQEFRSYGSCGISCKIEAQIVNDELLMHGTYCFRRILWSPWKDRFWWDAEKVGSRDYICLCSHLADIRGDSTLGLAVMSAIEHDGEGASDTKPSAAHSDLYQCCLCYTEFQVRVEDTQSDSPRIVVDVWQNLGEGVHLDDPKWTALRSYFGKETVNFEPGSIRAAYQSVD